MRACRLPGFVIAALAALACGASSASFPAVAGAQNPACSTAATDGAPTGWQCTFDDEFDGTQLDGSKWLPQQTDGTGFTSGTDPKACYIDDPQNISQSGGTLKLTARQVDAPFTCQSPDGNFQTQYTSGMVSSSEGRFSQTYGRYEIRAKVPPARVPGLQSALWLWPVNGSLFGLWPSSGEIDIAEMFSGLLDRAVPYIHYYTAGDDPTVTNENCMLDDLDQFHTYALIWTNSWIKIIYDGVTCLVHHYNPALPLLAPEPFNHPFYVALSQGLGIGDNAFDPQLTPLPATTEVDYVRVYQADGDPPPEDLDPPDTAITSGPEARTNNTTPTFTFESPSPDTTAYICRVDGTKVPCSGPGASHTTSQLTEGDHNFTVAALDAAGNVDQTPAIKWFTIDTTPPDTTVSGPSGRIADRTPTFDFSSPDPDASGIVCNVDGTVVGCSGPGASHTTAPLSDGDHTFSVAARDTAGNVDPTPASRAFTVDTTGPDTTLSGPSGLIANATSTFEFSSPGDAARFACAVDYRVVACSGPGNAHTVTLADGLHIFAVAAIDDLGNADATPAYRWIKVDTTPPETTVTGPSGRTADRTPTFNFGSPSSDANGAICRVDGTVVPCSGPGSSHTTGPLPDGDHTFSVAARDAAGNVDPTPATQAFTVDTTGPDTTVSGPSGLINDSTPTFDFSSPGDAARFVCAVDYRVVACSGPGNTHTTATLADGLHVFAVAALDDLGNPDATPAARWIKVDATPPDTTVSGPSGRIADRTPTFEFGSPSTDASGVVCSVDGIVVGCSGPGASHTTAPLLDGDHTFSVAARDGAGNVDPTPATRSFTVDTTAPDTILSGPSGTITTRTPTFEFSSPAADLARFICGVDGTVVACSGPGNTHTTDPLANGTHVFVVAAVDDLGNVDPTFEMRWFSVSPAAP